MLHSFHQDVLRKLPEDCQVRPNTDVFSKLGRRPQCFIIFSITHAEKIMLSNNIKSPSWGKKEEGLKVTILGLLL